VAMENPVLDQSLDLDGRELHRLAKLYNAPEWVKAASVPEICGEQIPPHMYADTRGHLYPIHTKAAIWTSMAFFLDKRAHFAGRHADVVQDRLLKAASFLGIRPDVDAMIARSGEISRHDDAKLPDDDFAYVGPGPAGTKERRLRLANPLEVKAAAEWLFRYRDELEFPERREIAIKVMQKAAQYGASVGDLDDFLEKSAGFGGCSCERAVAAVRQRAVLARSRHASESAELEKLATILEADPDRTRKLANLHKLAHTLETADRMLKVEYGGEVQRPEDVLFAVTRKAAASFAMEHVPTPSGSVYSRDDLGGLRVAQVRDHLGSDVADVVTSDGIHVDPEKLAEILPTFTRGDAETFDRMARSAGILARFKEAAASRQGLTPADLAAFAAQHRPG
jgi:hypothetical protein